MDDHAARKVFDLSNIHPSWSGVRIVAMEQPLHRGLIRLQAILDGADAVIIAVHAQFDYDRVYERHETIEPVPAGGDAATRSEAMFAAYFEQISARHPSMRLASKIVPPRNAALAPFYLP